ncbi:MAG: PDDEXK nuclease domain-containing protein [Paludibacteraceae bacterium]|nr:PDDEXK nuclease domain-containing protein [Paludibacteraceae bacterium]
MPHLQPHTNEISFINDIKKIVDEGRRAAYASVNAIMIETYWHIGQRIVEQEQKGSARAEYGAQLIELLSAELTRTYGNGFSSRYLRAFRQFYIIFPDIEIWKSRFPNLTWTHIFRTLRVNDETAIRWYLEASAKEMWSVRTLDRNISTQYFERHFKQPQLLTSNSKTKKSELLKSPIIAEFLGFKQDETYSESELENAIINHLQEFIMEMGRGFAFVARQQLIRTAAQDYYIDLVFYNIILKCYVLIDLKIGKIKHQDVGQMDMYVRMFDDIKQDEGNNPTIGILLCSETDEDIAKYSVLNGSEQLFASKYKLYLPTEEELRREIEQQKELYMLQHKH